MKFCLLNLRCKEKDEFLIFKLARVKFSLKQLHFFRADDCEKKKANLVWFSVVCTLMDNDTSHVSGRPKHLVVVDSLGCAS